MTQYQAICVGVLIAAIVVAVLAYAAHRQSVSAAVALEEAAQSAPSFVQRSGRSPIDTVNVLLVCAAVAAFFLAQQLDGPDACQSEQDIQDEVTALVGEQQPAIDPIRPAHKTAAQPVRRAHESVLAQAR